MQIHDCIVIGAGQTGLATGYKLQKAGADFLMLEAREETTGSFGSYYDSLKLFTPVSFSQLPGYSMSQDKKHYPTRAEFMAYLKNYKEHFKLPVITNAKVTSVKSTESGFLVETNGETYHTKTLVNASGPYSEPVIPAYPNQENFKGQILHSYAYKNSQGFEGKRIVVVGAGNSALQIAVELRNVSNVTVAVRRKIKWVSQKILGLDIHWWMHNFGIDHFPLKEKPKGGIPVIDTGGYRKMIKKEDFDCKTIFKGFTEEGVIWADGQEEKVDVVIYSTGFEPKLDWLAGFPIFDKAGKMLHKRGVSTEVPGMYFVGFFLQRNAASGNVRGAGYDAEFIVRRVMAHLGKNGKSASKDARQVAVRQLRRKLD